MNNHRKLVARFCSFGQGLGVKPFIAAAVGTLALAVYADDPPGKNISTNPPVASVSPPARPVQKKLSGAELYAINCNRCHSERYANERTPAQWETIMLHMRVRANLPAEQAREVVKFLQEDSGD